MKLFSQNGWLGLFAGSGGFKSAYADSGNTGHVAANPASAELLQNLIHDNFFDFSLYIGNQLAYNGGQRTTVFFDQFIQIGYFDCDHKLFRVLSDLVALHGPYDPVTEGEV